MTIDNRKSAAIAIKREQIEQARGERRIVFRVADHFLIRGADSDHARWYRVTVEEGAA